MPRQPPRRPSPPARPPLIDTDPKACIAKLQRRVDELEPLKNAAPGDPGFEICQLNIGSDVLDIFGAGSPEYEKYEHHQIWSGSTALVMGMSTHEVLQAMRLGAAETQAAMRALIARVQERIADATAHSARDAREAFKQLSIHPEILSACGKQFADGHYRDAILNAGIALVNYVKKKAGAPTDTSGKQLDNTPLMQRVFGGSAPILKVDPPDQDLQQGMMFLFSGATLGLRNPRAHTIQPDTAEYAVEAIAFLSFLMKAAEAAKL
jgi:uncharacterized protein (TIGR02391 family)